MAAVKEKVAKAKRKFQSRVMIVTPEMAEKWLEKNLKNRKLTKPLDDRHVQMLANEMKNGRWHLTGEAISFDWDDILLNGQHRLWACVLAGVPFETQVTYGVDPEARRVIDTQKKRTLAHYFQIEGEANTTHLAAATTLALRWDRGDIQGDGSNNPGFVSHEEAAEWLGYNNDLRESVVYSKRVYRELHYGRSAIAVSHYLNSRVDGEAADLFWEGARTGAELPSDSVILTLRRWTQNQIRTAAQRRSSLGAEVILVNYLKAMTMWREGRTARILVVKPGEKITTWSR